MYFGVLFKLFKVLEFMVYFKTWNNVEISETGLTEDLGARGVAPRLLWWLGRPGSGARVDLDDGLASDDGIDIVFEIQGVLTWWVLIFQIVLILRCSNVKGIRIRILRRNQEFAF